PPRNGVLAWRPRSHLRRTVCHLNMYSEAPVLERWLHGTRDCVAQSLADRIVEAQDIHTRSEPPNTQLRVDARGMQAIRDALDADHEDLGGYPGLQNLWNTISVIELRD
ncbi:MAG: hypothetical protein ACXVA6_22840, partial [Isosphaeraceae bacterium]